MKRLLLFMCLGLLSYYGYGQSDCPPDLDATTDTDIKANTLQASNKLTVNRKIGAGDTLKLIAGQVLELLPGFEADYGSTLEGGNGACVALPPELSILDCGVIKGTAEGLSEGQGYLIFEGGSAPYQLKWESENGQSGGAGLEPSGSNKYFLEGLPAGKITVSLWDQARLAWDKPPLTCEFIVPIRIVLEEDEECVRIGDDLPYKEGGQYICYVWTSEDEDANVPDDSTDGGGIEVCPDGTTTYIVTGSDGLNVTTDETHYEVVVCDLDISISDEALVLCGIGDSKTVSVSVNEDVGDLTYKWSNGEEGASIEITEVGTYEVTVTAEDGKECSESVSVVDGEDPDQIKGLFLNEGFVCIPINIMPPALINEPNKNQAKSLSCGSGSVEDGTQEGTTFSFVGVDEPIDNLCEVLNNVLDNTDFCTASPQALISDNQNFCNGNSSDFFNDKKEALDNSGAGIWIHLWENESGDDCMFIKAYGENGIGSSLNSDYFLHMFDQLLNDNIIYDNSLSSISDQLLNVIFNEALITSVDTIPLSTQDVLSNYGNPLTQVIPQDEILPSPIPCISDEPVVAISPAGVPICLPAGTSTRHMIKPKFSDQIDSDVLSGFTIHTGDQKGIYKGTLSCNVNDCTDCIFKGYVNTLTGKLYQFDPSKIDAADSRIRVRTGRIIDGECPNKYYEIAVITYEFSELNATGSGDLVSDLSDRYPVDEGQELPEYGSISLCPRDISSQNFNQPLAVNLNPHSLPDDSRALGGWLMLVQNSEGGVEYIYANYTSGTDPELVFWEFVCGIGWVPYNRPVPEEWITTAEFIQAILQAMIDQGHSALDVLGMIPGVGLVADIFNGIWYIVEGDGANATITFAAAIPGLGITIRGSEIIIKNGDIVLDITMIFRNSAGETITTSISKLHSELIGNGITFADDAQATRFYNWLYSIQDNGGDVIEAVIKNPDVVNIWKVGDELGWDNAKHAELLNFLFKAGKEELLDAFKANPDLVKAWDFLDGSINIRKDLTNLENMLIVLNDETGFLSQWLSTGKTLNDLKLLVNTPPKAALLSELADAKDYENFLETISNKGVLSKLHETLKARSCGKCIEKLNARGTIRNNTFKKLNNLPPGEFKALMDKYPDAIKDKILQQTGKPYDQLTASEIANIKTKQWKEIFKGYEAHHLIPAKVLETDALVFYYKNGGTFDFNNQGLLLPQDIHGSHRMYSEAIAVHLEELYGRLRDEGMSNAEILTTMDAKLAALAECLNSFISEAMQSMISMNQTLDSPEILNGRNGIKQKCLN